MWLSLDAEQVMENGLVVGTRNPTGDHILLDYRFEMPYGNDGPNALNFYLIFFLVHLRRRSIDSDWSRSSDLLESFPVGPFPAGAESSLEFRNFR